MQDLLVAFQQVLQPGVLLYLILGTTLGLVVGTLPGLTATMAVAILTPLTFWLPPASGLGVLIGVWNAAIFSGGISAILLNIPGTPASIASTFDGYPMAKKGQAGLALGINVLYSFIGGIFGIVVFLVAAFPLARFALSFGPAEYFALGLFGLSMMVAVSGTSIVKGLITGFIGLALSLVGLDPMLATPRFNFGSTDLITGLSFIPLMIGIFGLGEVFYQMTTAPYQPQEESGKKRETLSSLGRMLVNAKEFIQTLPAAIIGSVTGVIIGAIPGTGADIASLLGWEFSRRASKRKEEYGKGSIEGLVATCTANNACLGGALTTMMALGIPGDAVTAVLIGSFMMYGVQPGPAMFRDRSDFVFTVIGLMILANLFFLATGFIFSRFAGGFILLPKPIMWSTILILSLVGSFSLNNRLFDVWVAFLGGILGFLFRRYQFPIGPIILALILGPMVERNFRTALIISHGNPAIFLTRPISLIFIIGTVLALASPLFLYRKKEKKE
ncbi:MAG TPA: tripartite tricarboxylate transporter permease [Candidatus Atribacteria bacterium]|nr:tripartite tricarboxylate transporter permease [Candidatus Atribacteria bacterium]